MPQPSINRSSGPTASRLAKVCGSALLGALCLLPGRGLAQSAPERQQHLSPEEIIRQFDRDGDGKISRDEAPERMKARFDQIDTNHDGFITLDELKARDARVSGGGPPGGAGAPASGARGPAAAVGNRFTPGGPFTVITVGTGSPQYDAQRSGPCALIQYQGRYFLVDVGNGTQARLSELGVTIRQVDGLLVTHHHLDHNEEFIPLFIKTRIAGGRPEIIGPPGTAKLVEFVKDFYDEDITYRLERTGKTKNDFAPATVREVKGGETFDLGGVGGLKVTTAKVNHTIYTVAYRFDAPGQSIVISGDLFYSDSLVALAKNADVLVIDSGAAIVRQGAATRPAGAGRARLESVNDRLRAHSTLEDIVSMASKSGAKRLVLTHIAPGTVDEEATARSINEGYKGQVIVGHDLLEISPEYGVRNAATQPAAVAGGSHARVFVAPSSTAPDGKGWASAFTTLQPAIDAAAQQGGGEVWVAKGTYKPTNGTDRNVSIALKSGVAVYGGFAGTETQRAARDWERNATILSGDIGQPGVATDNSLHVVTGADDAILDGFTITAGYGMGGGPGGMPSGAGAPTGGSGGRSGPGGMGGPPGGPGGGQGGYPQGGAPMGAGGSGGGGVHITPDIVMRSAGAGAGAGMLNFQCAPTIRNCTFSNNQAGKGGAMYNMVARSFPPGREAAPAPLVLNCRFVDNSARGRGGAVSNDMGTSPTFRACTFRNNSCEGKGGAMYDDFGCSPILANCLFVANRAVSAAAMGNDGGSSPLLVHCTFTANVAQEEGAALYQGTGPANSPVVVGCILWGDICTRGPAEIFAWHDNDPQVSASCVQGGWVGKDNIDQDPQWTAATNFQPRAGGPAAACGYTVPTSDAMLQQVDTRPPHLMGRPEMVAATPVPTGTPALLCVNPGNTSGTADGTYFRSGFPTLQAALKAAAGRRAEIWVMAGTYKPTGGTDRSAAFVLQPGIEVYGGFRGTEMKRDQRDPKVNPTILSGAIGRPDASADHSLHVVIGADQAVLDGFTIRDGNADGHTYDAKGGGLINYRRGPQSGPMGAATGFSTLVRNCLFTHNHASEGGAVYDYDRGTPQYLNCRFVENSAEYGGAMVERVGVRAVLTGCEFQNNTAHWRAGAIYLDYGARPRLTDCHFTNNRSDCHGGALAMVTRASQLENTIPVLLRCSFTGNQAQQRGGAIFNFDASILGLDSCTFTANTAAAGGGALANDYHAKSVVVDCQFKNNHATAGDADIATDESSTLSRSRTDWPDQGSAAAAPANFGRRGGPFGPPGGPP